MNKLVCFLLFGCLAVTLTTARPACDDPELCGYLDEDETRERRQVPPGGGLEKELLEKLLMEKLNFLKNFGLLRGLPFIGEFVHNLVENDPQGVSRALSGGIFAVLDLALKALAAGAIGK